jgi:hypothetical protein
MEKNLLEWRPILCTERNKKLYVIDGQHRLAAAKMLKVDIWYEVVDNLTAEEILIINRNQKGWGSKDYLNHFASLGNNDYLMLSRYVKKTKLPVSTAVGLLSGNIYESGCVVGEKFKNGQFKVTKYYEAEMLFDGLKEIEKAGCSFYRDRSLVKALYNITAVYPKFDFKRLTARMKYLEFKKRAGWKDYVEQIDEFYNYRIIRTKRADLIGILKRSPFWK